MKNLIKVLPLIAVLSLTSCKKDQKADQLIVEEQQAVEAPVVQTQDDYRRWISQVVVNASLQLCSRSIAERYSSRT